LVIPVLFLFAGVQGLVGQLAPSNWSSLLLLVLAPFYLVLFGTAGYKVRRRGGTGWNVAAVALLSVVTNMVLAFALMWILSKTSASRDAFALAWHLIVAWLETVIGFPLVFIVFGITKRARRRQEVAVAS
jgi:hypothetical protein